MSHKGKPASDQAVQERLAEISVHALSFFENAAAEARKALDAARPPTANSFAIINTLTTDRALSALTGLFREKIHELRQLCTEPAIARVIAEDAAGERQIVFVSRVTPLVTTMAGGTLCVSYRAPMGRLAATQVGSECEVRIPRGVRTFDVIERAAFRPTETSEGWDSTNTVVEGQHYGPLTVVSLRALLRSSGVEEGELDLLERLLEEERTSSNVVQSIQRSVIEKMGLRDRPLLDTFQDEIFRLPLDSRLVILGPPGAGKTTTLIKRLGQKLDNEYLNEQERSAVEKTVAGLAGNSSSWLMFTPTDLLKQYVKEAFARENIPASDLRIQTWSDFRHDLARTKFGVLRTASGGAMY